MKKVTKVENDKLYPLETDNQRLVTNLVTINELKDEIEKEVMEEVTSMLLGRWRGM